MRFSFKVSTMICGFTAPIIPARNPPLALMAAPRTVGSRRPIIPDRNPGFWLMACAADDRIQTGQQVGEKTSVGIDGRSEDGWIQCPDEHGGELGIRVHGSRQDAGIQVAQQVNQEELPFWLMMPAITCGFEITDKRARELGVGIDDRRELFSVKLFKQLVHEGDVGFIWPGRG